MLPAGKLHLLVPKQRREPDSTRKPCGAFARSTGRAPPCQAPGNGRGGRCKLHGGMSTGPKTNKGDSACGKPCGVAGSASAAIRSHATQADKRQLHEREVVVVVIQVAELLS
jgi:hypothetical protein